MKNRDILIYSGSNKSLNSVIVNCELDTSHSKLEGYLKLRFHTRFSSEFTNIDVKTVIPIKDERTTSSCKRLQDLASIQIQGFKFPFKDKSTLLPRTTRSTSSKRPLYLLTVTDKRTCSQTKFTVQEIKYFSNKRRQLRGFFLSSS